MAHGILSPSGWNTWGHCPGSVWLSKDLPESTSPYAEEGTKAHELACALGLNKAGKAPDPDLSGYDDEMIRCARAWARLTNGYINADSGAVQFAYEDPVDLETVTGEKLTAQWISGVFRSPGAWLSVISSTGWEFRFHQITTVSSLSTRQRCFRG